MRNRLLLVGLLICSLSNLCAQDEQVPMGEAIVLVAKEYIGCPYTYAARGPKTFDCSGFVYYCSKQLGVNVPTSSSAQSQIGVAVEGGWDNLQAGDLIVFGIGRVQHVGLYVATRSANRHEFIHCSSSRGVMISALEDSYWRVRYRSARRYLDGNTDLVIANKTSQENATAPQQPTQQLSSAPAQPTSDIASGPKPVSKHWKTRVKRHNRKSVRFADSL